MRRSVFLPATAISMVLACGTGLFPAVAHADPPRESSLTCTAGGLREPPKFTQASPGRAEYSFGGVCIARDGKSLAYRLDGTWTPSETGGNANASELFHVDALSGPSQSYVALVGWRCPDDPWLHMVECQRVGQDIPDGLRTLWSRFAEGLSLPFSQRAIPAEQRPALIAQYERANGRLDRLQALTEHVRIVDPGDRHGAGTAAHAGRVHTATDAVALDPQPLPPRATDSATGQQDAASLNPQPLPPRQQSQPTTIRMPARGTETGIIIVSGKTPYRGVDKAAPALDVVNPRPVVDAPASP